MNSLRKSTALLQHNQSVHDSSYRNGVDSGDVAIGFRRSTSHPGNSLVRCGVFFDRSHKRFHTSLVARRESCIKPKVCAIGRIPGIKAVSVFNNNGYFTGIGQRRTCSKTSLRLCSSELFEVHDEKLK